MTKKLKKKFIIYTTLSVTIMLSVLLLFINIFNYQQMDKKSNQILQYIAQNNGKLPKPHGDFNKIDGFYREEVYETRYFVVYFDSTSVVIDSDVNNIYSINTKTAAQYAIDALKNHNNSDYINSYKYLKTNINGINAIIFIDAISNIRQYQNFLYNGIYLSLVAIVLTTIIAYILSDKVVKPIAIAYDKQNQFITNASHEIKTPLAIINANMDVLEANNTSNKWIDSSKHQVERLNVLVNNLVSLSKLNENQIVDKQTFNISEMIILANESYQSIALSQDKTLTSNIEENIEYNGSENLISQLLYILLDNAFKYSSDKANINLNLKKDKDKVIIEIENDVNQMTIGNHDQLFDRFYRIDQSHSSNTNGYGIGLSLAKSIVQSHQGKIIAFSKETNKFTINVILPNKKI
ncbi:MAG: HAMP domain-containing sensor histidine kinase [Erysipelotrichaceae bacterium]